MKWVSYFLFLVFCSSLVLGVVPVEGIQAVRQRTESSSTPLSDADKAQINRFLLSALNDIFLSKTSEEMAKTRHQILEQKGTKDLSLYATTYITLFREQLKTTAYNAIQRIEDPTRRLMVRRNLMILVSELRSLLLVEFGLERIQDPDTVIRYWAVKSLTNSSIAEQLNSEVTANPEAADQIYEKLKSVIQTEKQPEILTLVADFGAAWKDDRAAELLQQLAARRMEMYKTCSVQYKWLERPILSALAEKYLTQKLPDEKAKTARSFAELFAAIMQRFMQQQALPKDQKTFSEDSIFQMVTVMVEVEDRLLPKLEITPVGIKRALERDGDLKPAYDELFGTVTRPGVLSSVLKFNYGQNAGGGAITAPPILPPCPASTGTGTEG